MKNRQFQNEILDILMDISSEFREFYSDNEETLEKLEIFGFEKHNQDQCSPRLDGKFVIKLKEIPPSDETAFIVAHELYHAILWFNGYPNLMSSCEGPREDFRSFLNSMVYDHYINTKLRKYFKTGCQKIKSKPENFYNNYLKGKDTFDDKSEIRIIFFCVNIQLNFEILCDNGDFQKTELFSWFEKRPEFRFESNKLISMIQSTDMNNPKKVFDLFQNIIDLYPILNSISPLCGKKSELFFD